MGHRFSKEDPERKYKGFISFQIILISLQIILISFQIILIKISNAKTQYNK